MFSMSRIEVASNTAPPSTTAIDAERRTAESKYRRSAETKGAFLRYVLVLFLFAFPPLGCYAAEPAKDKVMYGVPGTIGSAVANLAFAQELGYFDRENIEFDMIGLPGSGVIVPQLLTGQLQASAGSIDPLIIARQPGKPHLPLRFVYNLVRTITWQLVVRDGGPISSTADLAGKTIGVISLATNNSAAIQMLRAAGVDPKSVKFQAVGLGAQALDALQRGEVAALYYYDVLIATMEATGAPVRRLPVPEELKGFGTNGIQGTEKIINEKPDLIGRFGRVVAMGTVACMANNAGCVKAFWKRYPNYKPKGGTEEDNLRKEIVIMRSRLANLTYFGPGQERLWGAYTDTTFKTLIAHLKEGGDISEVNIPMESLYTNRFVPEYNKFDAERVRREAQAYK